MSLSESQWRKIETISRVLLAVTIIAGISYGAGTGYKIHQLNQAVKNGNCSYLLESGYIQQQGLGNTTLSSLETNPPKPRHSNLVDRKPVSEHLL